MKSPLAVCLLTAAIAASALGAGTAMDTIKDTNPTYKFSVSSSAFSIFNLFPDDVSIYELHFRYRITPRDVIAIEASTWKIYAPIGIPYGPHIEQKSERYPGRIRESGVGVSYQRFLWKGLFASLQVLPLWKIHLDEDNKKIQDGFRLYTTYRLGYYLPLFRNRCFVEPFTDCVYWPINTNLPQSFKVMEDKWPNYFLFEPGLHFGINF